MSTRPDVMHSSLEQKATYRSIKVYDHNEGLSCCFRQWRATHSHCHWLHGYALGFKIVLATHHLDENNWCYDFGAMKPIKKWLHELFDHTLLIAEDDPFIDSFRRLAEDGLVDIRIVPAVGCEAIAKLTFDQIVKMISADPASKCWVESVEVREHSGNSATYQPSMVNLAG